ncbi:MAG: hypothetical protein Q7S61_02860 [bacterium]|nr:hypothetical protein [bacterium]
MKKDKNIEGFFLLALVLAVYIFTVHPFTKSYSFHILVFFLIFFIGSVIFWKKNTSRIVFSGIGFVIFAIGITGWFFSPFFSWLYIIAIALTFLYSRRVSIFFVAMLIGLLLPNVGSIDVGLDILTLLSLVFIVPLSFFLHKEYLHLKEKENKILILKEEQKKFRTLVHEVLSNKITKFAVDLREPLNDIKQLAQYSLGAAPDKNHNSNIKKIADLSEKGLTYLKKFEEQVTGIKLLENPKKE